MNKWEYCEKTAHYYDKWDYLYDCPASDAKVITPDIVKWLNLLGKDGWELVKLDRDKNSSRCLFKRKVEGCDYGN